MTARIRNPALHRDEFSNSHPSAPALKKEFPVLIGYNRLGWRHGRSGRGWEREAIRSWWESNPDYPVVQYVDQSVWPTEGKSHMLNASCLCYQYCKKLSNLRIIIPVEIIITLFSIASSSALWPTQSLVQWVLGVFLRDWRFRSVKVTTRRHIMPRLHGDRGIALLLLLSKYIQGDVLVCTSSSLFLRTIGKQALRTQEKQLNFFCFLSIRFNGKVT
jgi:hypothetical protein